MTTSIFAAAALLAATPFPGPQGELPGDASPSEEATTLPAGLSSGHLTGLAEELILDEPGDGHTWARAATWKASFGPDGFDYIPFFGSDAPENYPVRLDLSSVRSGGQELSLGARVREREGQSVTLDRGSMREVYHLAKEGIEQTFVFDSVPTQGDLVLELDVATKLAVRPEGDGFVFWNELGSVGYGAATAVDGAGRRLGLNQWLEGSTLRIEVPAEFLEYATFPLVVDPILNTFDVTSNARRQVDVDVAYEGNNSTYQIVFSELQSALDQDVIAVSYNASLDLLLPAASMDITSATWTSPRNASAYNAQQFLCIAVVGNTFGSRHVWGRTREAGSGVRGPQFQISGAGGEVADVGGQGGAGNTNYDYMVVWQEADGINLDFDIVAQAVRDDSTLMGSRNVIDGDVGDLDRDPSISKSSGRPELGFGDHEYMIVWERELSPTDHNIRAQVIEYTGVMTGHSQFNAYTFSDALDPDVSSQSTDWGFGGERYWSVVFERLVGSDYDIFAVVATDGNADNARSLGVMQDLNLQDDDRDPRICFDSNDYLVTYQTSDGAGNTAVHWTGFNVVHDDDELRVGLCTRRESLSTSTGSPARLAMASHWDGGGPANGFEPGDALTAWVLADGGSPSGTDVAGAIVAEIITQAIGSQYCSANPNSTGLPAWIRAIGSDWSPTGLNALVCSDMPQNSFGHFIVSNQSGFTPNAGTSMGNLCLQGTVGRFSRPGEIRNSGSGGAFSLNFHPDNLPGPNGTMTALSGETWFFQCWFRDFGPTSNFSNGVEITFD